MSTSPDFAATRNALLRRGRRLEIFTVLWNSIEGVVSVALGIAAGSIALVGFGMDSFVETSSGLILLWRLKSGRDAATEQRVEQRALKLVGLSLLALAVYITFEAAASLWTREAPQPSTIGIALACVSLVVMPILARAKRRVGMQLGSRALIADSFQTSICMYLSVILLGGLLLNASFGFWWADPLAALVMVPIVVREGIEASRGKHCDDCS
ncbi:MAG: cation transporter [Longimicrobiales bacterium]